TVKIILGLLVFIWKPWLGILFLVVYAVYVKRELSADEGAMVMEELEPLKIRPRDPSMFWAVLQTALALAAIAAASHVFVLQIEAIGVWLGIAPYIAALVLAPVATELPEIMNAFIWV